MVYGFLFLKEQPSLLKIGEVLIAFLGASLVAGIHSSDFSQLSLDGVLFALLAAIFYAALILISRNVQKTDLVHFVFLQTLIGAITLFLWVDFNVDISAINPIAVLTIGILHTAIMYLLFLYGVKRTPVMIVALFGFIDPVAAILLDFIVLNAQLTFAQWIGVALIGTVLGIKTLQEQAVHSRTLAIKDV